MSHACGPRAGRPKTELQRTLKPLEIEVARLVVKGFSNRQITARLGMAERAVKYHLTFVFDALGVHQRSELADVVNGDPAALGPDKGRP